MKPFQLNRRGVSILSVLVGSLMMMASYWAYIMFQDSVLKQQTVLREKYNAKLFALELGEFFRGFNSSTALQHGYLALLTPPISFCTPVNKLDRTTGLVSNPDPITSLPPNYLDGADPLSKANRYYQVDVVNVKTTQIGNAYCGQSLATTTLGPNERILVTIGIGWVPHGKLVADATTLEVPAIIPGK